MFQNLITFDTYLIFCEFWLNRSEYRWQLEWGGGCNKN